MYNRLCDLLLGAFSVLVDFVKNAFEYETELSALREELASWKARCTRRVEDIQLIAGRLTAAEQRNAELTAALIKAREVLGAPVWDRYAGLDETRGILDAALKPTESGASE